MLVEPKPERAAAPISVALSVPPPAPRATPPAPPPAAAEIEIDPDLDMSSVVGDEPEDPSAPSDAVRAAALEGPSGDPEAAIDALDQLDES